MPSDEKSFNYEENEKVPFFSLQKTCWLCKTLWPVLCFAGKKSRGNKQVFEVQAGSASDYQLAWSWCEQKYFQEANC